MERKYQDRYKQTKFSTQNDRRMNLIERQKKARQLNSEKSRGISLVEQAMDVEAELPVMDQPKTSKYANQLMLPEWMLEVPSDFSSSVEQDSRWFVVPRPEGKRCMVISLNGKTIARTNCGRVFKRFDSTLPDGSKARCKRDQYCILDCIFNEDNQTFYVLDLMCWKGYMMYDCTTEFRYFWIQSKLEEENLTVVDGKNKHAFERLPYFDANTDGISEAYAQDFGFQKDGMLFYDKESHYEIGLSPCSLLWKDQQCSRFCEPAEYQHIVLKWCGGTKLLTHDEIELEGPHDMPLMYSKDILLRFSISGAEIVNGTPKLQNIQFAKESSKRRPFPDSWSKIYFKYAYHGRSSLPIQKLLHQVEEGCFDEETCFRRGN